MTKEKLVKFKEKHRRIADLKKAGKSEKEIARELNCSHQNINLILKKYFFDENIPNLKRGRTLGYSPFEPITLKCAYCKKVKELTGSISNKKKIYCNQICYLKSEGKNINVNVRQMTKSEYRAYQRARCNKYYHQHKNEPHFIELRKIYNRTALLNRKKKLVPAIDK